MDNLQALSWNALARRDYVSVKFVNGVTSHSVMLLDGENILGYALEKNEVQVYSWNQKKQNWMKNDIAVHSKYLMQRMKRILIYSVMNGKPVKEQAQCDKNEISEKQLEQVQALDKPSLKQMHQHEESYNSEVVIQLLPQLSSCKPQ